MFGFKNSPPAAQDPSPGTEEEPKRGLFSRLRQRLSKTGDTLTSDLDNRLAGKHEVDDAFLEELEDRLLMADVGVEATRQILAPLSTRENRRRLANADAFLGALRDQMVSILAPCNKRLSLTTPHKPFVILVVGVNGSGKTTTIGKLARRFQSRGKSVMLAAGDTFRAAAVEQLLAWGERNQVPVIAQGSGADSASVTYDALQAARTRGTDILIADTAGRLHTQSNLMEELKKVKRVLAKLDASAPHEIMLVVEAGTGQNALNQAREFHAALGLTGITVTKLDGTAKGGILFAIANKLKIPIRFIGVGEAVEDLQAFDAYEFARALMPVDEGRS